MLTCEHSSLEDERRTQISFTVDDGYMKSENGMGARRDGVEVGGADGSLLIGASTSRHVSQGKPRAANWLTRISCGSLEES